MSLDQGLLEAAIENLENSISEYNDRYGYLGANWEDEVQTRFDDGEWISFRVYFEGDYSYDSHFEDGEWSPDTYIERIAEDALEFAIEEDRIENPLPEFIEPTY